MAEVPALSESKAIRRYVRRELPPSVFARRPYRLLYLFPLVTLISCQTAVLAADALPWYASLLGSVVLGVLYSSLFFFAHEVGHGAVVKSPFLQHLTLYCGLCVFCLSPHLWQVWHNQAHHGNTNTGLRDPDVWGTMTVYNTNRSARLGFWLSPGSGTWFSALYLPTWFTLHSQQMLWNKSRRHGPAFDRLSLRRATIDSLLMITFWIVLGVTIGGWGTLVCILIPMAVANAVIMSYISTNHMMSSMVESDNVLDSTMSVTSWKIVDRFHFHFSHHVEHHLFPAMGTDQAPRVRQVLKTIAGDRYRAPRHGRALAVLFRTPRVYLSPYVLYDPRRGTRVPIDRVMGLLQNESQPESEQS